MHCIILSIIIHQYISQKNASPTKCEVPTNTALSTDKVSSADVTRPVN